jgi:hypothetical protein
MVAFQTIATAMFMNFGHSFRQHWIKNYVFMLLSDTWMLCVFIITLYPSLQAIPLQGASDSVHKEIIVKTCG